MISRRSTARFFLCFCHPCDGFFFCFTLRTGVILSSTIDIVLGLISISRLLNLTPNSLLIDPVKPILDLYLLVLSVPFGFLGLIGILQMHRAKVTMYSGYKHLEWLGIVVLTVIEGGSAGEWPCVYFAWVFYVGRVVLDLYLLYAIWSCSSHLSHGHEELILQGSTENTRLLTEKLTSR